MFMNEHIRVMVHDDLYHSTLLRMIYQRALLMNEFPVLKYNFQSHISL